MKNLITILCLFVFSGCAFAEGYYLPSYEPDITSGTSLKKHEKQINNVEKAVEQTETEVEKTDDNTKVKVKRVRNPKNRVTSPNSYYNFGGTEGYKGRF